MVGWGGEEGGREYDVGVTVRTNRQIDYGWCLESPGSVWKTFTTSIVIKAGILVLSLPRSQRQVKSDVFWK